MNKKHIRIGFFITAILLFINLLVINDYGITWDYHHVFFGGLYHLRQPMQPEYEDHLPFTEPDPRYMEKTPFGPIMTATPVFTYKLLYEKLKLLPFDIAFLLPTVIIGTLGFLVLFLFLLEALSFPVALISGLFLMLYPRYFSDLHINFKDTPQAVIFTVNIWLFWRLVKHKRIQDLILACLAFAIALNVKVNAVYVMPITGLWSLFAIHRITSFTKVKQKNLLLRPFAWLITLAKGYFTKKTWTIGAYFPIALLSSFLLWAFFWDKPLGHFLYLIDFFKDNTLNIEVLLNGAWYCSAKNVPWFYPYWYMGIVTPLPILLFFLLGLLVALFQSIVKRKTFPILLLLWLFLPLTRYLTPKIGVIDGIRHFEEIIFPFLIISAIGAVQTWQLLNNITPLRQGFAGQAMKTISITTAFLVFTHLAYNIVYYHPFQIAYYNELVGGAKEAVGKYDLDYWGTSQKKAVQWLNKNAPENSKIFIAMSADTAGKYLRPDLLETLNMYTFDESDYVVLLNRQSFFYRYFYIHEYMLMRKTAHVVTMHDVPMVWIFDNNLGQFPRGQEWWKDDDPCIKHYWHSPVPDGTHSYPFGTHNLTGEL